MMQEYISRPSGNCSATRLAPAWRRRQTDLWICGPQANAVCAFPY